MVTHRSERCDVRVEAAVVAEQLLRPVGTQPLVEQRQVLGVVADAGERDLMGTLGALDGDAVDLARPGPALRCPQHDHRPARRTVQHALGGLPADGRDLVQRRVHRGGHPLMDDGRIFAVEPPCDDIRVVAVAAHQVEELVLVDPGEHGRVGDLVTVEVENRQDRAVIHRIEELVAVPAGRERSGLGLTVADDTRDQQTGVVERDAVGVGEGVAELAAFVDRARRLGRGVARHAAGERELPEQLPDAVGVGPDMREELTVGSVEPRVRDHARPPVPGPADIHGVKVA